MNFEYIKQELQKGRTFKSLSEELNIPLSTLKTRCNKLGIYARKIKSENSISANTKICPCCKKEKSLSDFYFTKNKIHSYCKNCLKILVNKRNLALKQEAVLYKGGKCEICGYDKCLAALEFHHLDPSKKDFQISGTHLSFDKLKSELDKCRLVCANCHREIHAITEEF